VASDKQLLYTLDDQNYAGFHQAQIGSRARLAPEKREVWNGGGKVFLSLCPSRDDVGHTYLHGAVL
jgi:hypothetical protein